jgi:cellulose biosynthesis protein BcsQ
VLTPRRIAFINEKGGSAKTTLVANLAAYLALKRGRRVLAIDMDPQGQLGKVLGLDIHRTRRSSIDLLLDSVLGDAGLDGAARFRNAKTTRARDRVSRRDSGYSIAE